LALIFHSIIYKIPGATNWNKLTTAGAEPAIFHMASISWVLLQLKSKTYSHPSSHRQT
jgi:hypothetical protein